MSHHVTSYHFESRGTVTRPTLHCQLTSSTRNQFKLSMTVFVGCPEGCRYHTASAVYDLVNNNIIIITTDCDIFYGTASCRCVSNDFFRHSIDDSHIYIFDFGAHPRIPQIRCIDNHTQPSTPSHVHGCHSTGFYNISHVLARYV